MEQQKRKMLKVKQEANRKKGKEGREKLTLQGERKNQQPDVEQENQQIQRLNAEQENQQIQHLNAEQESQKLRQQNPT